MSSSAGDPTHRRRSLSASQPPSGSSGVWNLATKRAHPSYRNSPAIPDLTSPQKWDVDMWRRGKRARRDSSTSLEDLEVNSGSTPLSCRDSHSSASTSSFPPTPIFPATSEEFLLFPKRKRQQGGSIGMSRRPYRHKALLPDGSDDLNEADLTRLRSDAFWALRRSIAESGEGLVKRMREFEDSRSRLATRSKMRGNLRRGRQRYSPNTPALRNANRDSRSDEDEDDVQIFAGDSCAAGSLPLSGRKKRAFSLDMMELDTNCDEHRSPSQGVDSGHWCSSPVPTYDSTQSSYSSDIESSIDDMDLSASQILPSDPIHSSSSSPSKSPPFPTAFTPASSYTSASSTNSSLVSLALPSLLSHHRFGNQANFPGQPSALQTPMQYNSYSEKAVAALSLALANGAGGIDDYESLRSLGLRPVMEDGQVGELWH